MDREGHSRENNERRRGKLRTVLELGARLLFVDLHLVASAVLEHASEDLARGGLGHRLDDDKAAANPAGEEQRERVRLAA